MAFQTSTAVRNAAGDAIETAIGASPVLKIRTGALPTNCAAADTGAVLATVAPPADWLTAGNAGVKSKQGTWQDTAADASGESGHWRLYASDGTTCHFQGNVSAPWTATKAYGIGATVHNGGNIYRATAAGVSAGSGGPSGTGGAIVDGGVTWAYVQTGTDMTIENGAIVAGQAVTIGQFDLTIGGA